MLDNNVLAFAGEQLAANNRYDAKSIFTQYKQHRTLDLFRQFQCRQAIVALVNGIKSTVLRLKFVADGLPQILAAASDQDWLKIEQISLNHSTEDDANANADGTTNFMENITKLYDLLAIIKTITITVEENRLIAAAILNADVPLTPPIDRTICKRCFEPDDSVECRKHTCKKCLNSRRPRRSSSAMHHVEVMCTNCTVNDNVRRCIPIECSICCDKHKSLGKSKRCTDCPNQFHEKCHPNRNVSKCPECTDHHRSSNNRKNHVRITKIDGQFWPVVIVPRHHLPMDLAEQKFSNLKPGAIVAFSITKNVYRRVYAINLLPLHFNNPMARDALCQPHVTGLRDAIQISETICSGRRSR